ILVEKLGAARLTCTVTSPSGSADRKSTRLNSSHVKISYAVFCLKKKQKRQRLARRGARCTRLRGSGACSPPPRRYLPAREEGALKPVALASPRESFFFLKGGGPPGRSPFSPPPPFPL